MIVSLKNLRQYLENKGWEREVFSENLDKISLKDKGEKFIIVIPNKESILDYEIRIKNLLDSLSSIEGREVNKIINDITFGKGTKARTGRLMKRLWCILSGHKWEFMYEREYSPFMGVDGTHRRVRGSFHKCRKCGKLIR